MRRASASAVVVFAVITLSVNAGATSGYSPPITDAANIPWTSQDSNWLSIHGADQDAWDIANLAVTATAASAQAIHDFLRGGGVVYLLIPGYNPGGDSRSRSDWEIPAADYLIASNNGNILVMELDYWRTNLIYGWAFDDGQSKAQRFATKAKSAGASRVIMYAHSLGADILGRVTQDNANVEMGYGFGIPCFSTWAPKNRGFSYYQGMHRENGGKYIVFSRISDPASQDGCAISMLGNWSSNSGSVPGHDYMELTYDNSFHRYVNTDGSVPGPAVDFMTALANFKAGTLNEDVAAGSTYNWNKTAADYRTVKFIDDSQATLMGASAMTVLTGDGFNNAVRRAYANGTTASAAATWAPLLTASTKYEARVFIPYITGTATLTYRVCGSGPCRDVQVRQASYYDAWVSLGTFTATGTAYDYVYVSNATGTCCSESVAFDAVEFIPKSQ